MAKRLTAIRLASLLVVVISLVGATDRLVAGTISGTVFDDTVWYALDQYQPDYDRGHADGYTAGYSSGLERGAAWGTSTGRQEGKTDGYRAGWKDAFRPAYDRSYANHYERGFNELYPLGEAFGYEVGFAFGLAVFHDRSHTGGTGSYASPIERTSGSSGGGGYPSHSGDLTISVRVYGQSVRGRGGASLPAGADPSQHFYDAGYADGQIEGRPVGYDFAYQPAYDSAHASAYGPALLEGRAEGTTYGVREGRIDGVNEGRVDGADRGETDGFYDGYQAGFRASYDASFDHSVGGLRVYTLAPALGFAYTPVLSSYVVPIPEPASLGLAGVALLTARRRF